MAKDKMKKKDVSDFSLKVLEDTIKGLWNNKPDAMQQDLKKLQEHMNYFKEKEKEKQYQQAMQRANTLYGTTQTVEPQAVQNDPGIVATENDSGHFTFKVRTQDFGNIYYSTSATSTNSDQVGSINPVEQEYEPSRPRSYQEIVERAERERIEKRNTCDMERFKEIDPALNQRTVEEDVFLDDVFHIDDDIEF